MAKREVLARVQDDLARGHTHAAIQRLRTLLANDPDDLAVRVTLARVYRSAGNLVEAGRWGYLSDDLRPQEAAAFARAHPSPWLRLRVLRFTGDPAALPPAALLRLRELTEQARRSGAPARSLPDGVDTPPRGTAVPCLFVAATLVAVGVLAAIGLYRALHWMITF